MFSKFQKSLSFQILAGVIGVIILLGIISGFIGYEGFTYAVERLYADGGYNTVRTASEFVDISILRSDDYKLYKNQVKLTFIHKEWSRLADTQNATFIYLFRCDTSDYRDLTFFLSAMNSSDSYEEFVPGKKFFQPDMRFFYPIKRIYEEGSEYEAFAIYRPEEGNYSGSNMTVYMPFKDSDGKVLAIMGVEKRMEFLTEIRRGYLNRVIVASALMILVVLLLYGIYLSRNLINPIKNIADEATRFARENTQPEILLSKKIRVKNELGQLANTIDLMESDILKYINDITNITREKEQIKAELNVATQIQADMLPRIFPPYPDRKEFEIYASMNPAKEVGGDFYDFFLIDDDHLALVIADVSGKGVPAALFMVIAKTLIKNRAQYGGSPSQILRDVNMRLCEGNEAELFVTVWLGILEISSGQIICSNAGHECPAVKKLNGGYELIKSKHSPAVATIEGIKFRESEIKLNPGEIIYLYTDGVAEATNINNELYGTDRMLNDLNKTIEINSVREILKFMKKSVDEFTGEAPQFDDITMLCVKYLGNDGNNNINYEGENY